MRRPLGWPAAAMLLVGVLAAGCREIRGPSRPAFSALWIEGGAPAIEANELARLAEVGVGEAFLEVADLDAPGEEARPAPASPPVPTTLVVSGDFAAGDDPGGEAERLATALRQLRFDFEARGGIAVGWHLDPEPWGPLDAHAELLRELRRALGRELTLSTSLERRHLADEAVGEVAEAVDYVVPFLYGQRPGEAEDARAWDLNELGGHLRRLEELGRPYLVGVATLGTATHLGKNGEVKATTTRASLGEILRDRALKLRPGFSLEGANRRVYSLAAERSTRVGEWELRPGEVLRTVRPASSDLEELLRLLGAAELPRHLGQVYYRLPAAEERLSLSIENLTNALAPTPATPELGVGVQIQRRVARGWRVRFAIENRNGEITELSFLDNNYLEARCRNGTFHAEGIDAGEFYRFELYRAGGDGELVRGFRRADVLRLYAPILEGDERVTSGDVELRLRGEPELEVSGRFLLSDGRTLELEPVVWPPAAGG